MRLQKAISFFGVCSRRKAEELIVDGKVAVNNEVIKTLGTSVDIQKDIIKVKNKPINKRVAFEYYVLYKPKGYVTSLEEGSHLPSIKIFMKHIRTKVTYAGRLDFSSEGLLILSNDGELVNRLTHPSYKLPKTYEVKVKGVLSEDKIKRLRGGVYIDDEKTRPAEITVDYQNKDISIMTFTICEGHYHQIRKMCESEHLIVLRLKRTQIGNIFLDKLKPGECVPIKQTKLLKLKQLIGL